MILARYSDKKSLLDHQFKLLKQRICCVCSLRGRDRLKACSNCQIMHLLHEIKRRIPKGNNDKVGKLEKFK
jgi:hypothetical protein